MKHEYLKLFGIHELLKVEARTSAHVLLETEPSSGATHTLPKRLVGAIEELCVAALEAAEQRNLAPRESKCR